MKITRKEFVNAMVSNETIFIGRTRKVLESSEVECAIADFFKHDDIIVEKRSCKAYSNHLEFSGGSRLDFHGGKYGKYEFDKCTVFYNECYSKDADEPWIVCWYMVEK